MLVYCRRPDVLRMFFIVPRLCTNECSCDVMWGKPVKQWFVFVCLLTLVSTNGQNRSQTEFLGLFRVTVHANNVNLHKFCLLYMCILKISKKIIKRNLGLKTSGCNGKITFHFVFAFTPSPFAVVLSSPKQRADTHIYLYKWATETFCNH